MTAGAESNKMQGQRFTESSLIIHDRLAARRPNNTLQIIHSPILNPLDRLIPVPTHMRLSLARGIKQRLRAL